MTAPTLTKLSEWVLKEEAARMLKLKPAAVELRARRGWLKRKYLERLPNEKQGRVVYLRADIEKLKRGEIPESSATVVDPVTKQRAPQAVAKTGAGATPTEAWQSAFAQVVAKFGEQFMHSFGPPPYKQAWLTFDEALAHSGHTPMMLTKLILGNKVMSYGRGPKTWRVSRVSLDAYDGGKAAS